MTKAEKNRMYQERYRENHSKEELQAKAHEAYKRSLLGKCEKEVLKECLQVLDDMGIYHWRQNTGAFKTTNGGFFRSSRPGISDILGVLPGGRILAVECKRAKGGVLSDAQKEFLESIDSLGGVAIVASDAEKLREMLQEDVMKQTKDEIQQKHDIVINAIKNAGTKGATSIELQKITGLSGVRQIIESLPRDTPIYEEEKEHQKLRYFWCGR